MREGATYGEFYYLRGESPQLFSPHGNSWVILHPHANGEKHHANFSRGIYASETTEKALTEMQKRGYNLVRVFLFKGHPTCNEIVPIVASNQTTRDLNQEYMDNFLGFLK